MGVLCHSCNQGFPDYGELAKHIASSKKGHRKGKKWAAKYLLRTRELNKKKEMKGRVALTEAEKENKKDTVRELSGETTIVETYCPHCKRKSRQIMPMEFGESGNAWKIGGCLAVLCNSCRGLNQSYIKREF